VPKLDFRKPPSWLVSLIACVILAAVGWLTTSTIQRSLSNTHAKQLNTVLQTSVSALELWIESQKVNVSVYANEPEIRKLVEELVRLGRGHEVSIPDLLRADAQQQLRDHLRPMCKAYGYIGFVVTDQRGVNIGSLLDEPIGQRGLYDQSHFLEDVLDSGRAQICKPFIAKIDLPDEAGVFRPNRPTMFVSTPVLDQAGEIIATLSFRIRPEQDFTRILSVSRAGLTGETYAFDRQGLMLSDSRFNDQLKAIGLTLDAKNQTAILNIRLTDPGGDMTEGFRPTVARDRQPMTRMAQSATSGETGVDTKGYRDYRGVPVIGAWTWLEAYGFGVASEIDVDEAYVPLRKIRYSMLSIFVLLLGTTLVSIGLDRRKQQWGKRVQKGEAQLHDVVKQLENQKFAMDQHAIVSIADIRGNITYANDKFCQLSGYTLDELVGQNHRVVKSDEHDHAFYRDLWKTISGGNTWRGEVKNRAKDGTYYWVDATIVPFKDEQGKITQYVAVRTDITAMKDNDQELRASADRATLLQKVGSISESTREFEAAIQKTLDLTCEVLQWQIGHCYRRSSESNSLLVPSGIWHIGVGEAHHRFKRVTEQTPFNSGVGLPGRVLESGKVVWIQDVCENDSFTRIDPSGDFDIQSAIAFPVIVDGRIEAVLEFFSEKSHSGYSETIETIETIETLEAVGRQLGSVLENQRASQAVLESELRYKLAVNGSRDGLWDWDLITDRVHYAPQWQQMLGLGPEDKVTDSPDEWISRIDLHDVEAFRREFDDHLRGKDETFEVELRMAHKLGHTVWMLCRGAVVRDDAGQAIRVAGSMADITEIKEAQDTLRRLSEHDRLTDLPNRELFKKKLEKTIQRAQDDPDHKFAVLFFDFDRFKVINDSLGHNVGDALLIDIAKLFEYNLRHGNTAARFGGDEFVVLLDDLSDYQEASETADRLLEIFAKPHDLLGHSVTSTASIGLVTNEQGYTSADDMIRDADAAMYQAKETGKNQTVVFDKTMHENAMDRLILETDLRLAITDDQLKLYYQPIIELSTGELSGFEALIRWEHHERGLISPDDFIPIAEDTGLIVDIGRWVFQTAARQIADWNRRLCPGRTLSMNVNVSKRQLLNPTFMDEAIQCQREHGLHSKELKIEITESLISDDRADVASLLRDLRTHGFLIVMDDFGTGVSSLSTLHDYPIDILKIDQSFIRVLDSDRSLLAVVASITSLAENLGILTVAEGVETQDIVGALQSIDCTWAQGYHFAKPLTLADAEAYILGMNENKRSA